MDDKFSKQSILRLARRAGVKNLSEECYGTIKNLIRLRVRESIRLSLIANNERGTKTLMLDDVVDGLRLVGTHVCKVSVQN